MEKNEKKIEEINSKNIFLVVILLFLLVVLVIGVTYQIYMYTDKGTNILNKIFGGDQDIFKNGSVTIVYTEGENKVKIENALPMTDSEGMSIRDNNEIMDFSISVNITKNSNVSYQVVAQKDKESTLPDEAIKIYLQRSIDNTKFDEEVLKPTLFKGVTEENDYGVPLGDMVIDEVTTNKSVTYYYRLRMWLDENYLIDNSYKYFTIKIDVYGKGQRIRDNNTENTKEVKDEAKEEKVIQSENKVEESK